MLIVWQSSISEAHHIYLSIATPLLSQGVLLSDGLSPYTVEMVKQICSHAVDIIEPAKEGYQLTLRIDSAKILHGEGSFKLEQLQPSLNRKLVDEKN